MSINAMIDAACICTNCKQPAGRCRCWGTCPGCGRGYLIGHACATCQRRAALPHLEYLGGGRWLVLLQGVEFGILERAGSRWYARVAGRGRIGNTRAGYKRAAGAVDAVILHWINDGQAKPKTKAQVVAEIAKDPAPAAAGH